MKSFFLAFMPTVIFLTSCGTTTKAPQAMAAPPAAQGSELQRARAEIAQLKAQIRDLEARLAKANKPSGKKTRRGAAAQTPPAEPSVKNATAQNTGHQSVTTPAATNSPRATAVRPAEDLQNGAPRKLDWRKDSDEITKQTQEEVRKGAELRNFREELEKERQAPR